MSNQQLLAGAASRTLPASMKCDVAIVGCAPAGITCAALLAMAGHCVFAWTSHGWVLGDRPATQH